MTFKDLTEREQREIINDIMDGLCDGCEERKECTPPRQLCYENAKQIAIEQGEYEGYVLVEDVTMGCRSVERKCDIMYDDNYKIIKE